MPVSNSYKTYKPGRHHRAGRRSFVYWTSPVINTATGPSTRRHRPVDGLLADRAGGEPGRPSRSPRSRGLPFTKAGCSVGDFSTANMVLENTGDIPTVFGAGRPRPRHARRRTSRPRYIGEAIHCGLGDATCETAQRAPSTDTLAARRTDGPATPAFRRCSATSTSRRMLGGGTPDLPHPATAVTDAPATSSTSTTARSRDFRGHARLPRLQPDRLAEPGRARRHAGGRHPGHLRLHLRHPRAQGLELQLHDRRRDRRSATPSARATPATWRTPQRYDQAFAKFLDRLAKDGITPTNTLFVIGAEENDHFAGANVGRAEPADDPAGLRRRHDAVPVRAPARSVSCRRTCPASSPRRARQHHAVRSSSRRAPRSTCTARRQASRADRSGGAPAERDTAAITADNPYSGTSGEKIVNYQAGAIEQRILHLETADPLRTPTFTVFPKPDYFFGPRARRTATRRASASPRGSPGTTATTARTSTSPGTAFVGPGVKRLGVDGPEPADRPTA